MNDATPTNQRTNQPTHQLNEWAEYHRGRDERHELAHSNVLQTAPGLLVATDDDDERRGGFGIVGRQSETQRHNRGG